MKLTLHVKDVGSFDVALHPDIAKNLNDEMFSKLSNLLNTTNLYILLENNQYLFLSKNLIENTYMVLDAN